MQKNLWDCTHDSQLICYVTGGLHIAKSMGLHTAKSWSGGLGNLQTDIFGHIQLAKAKLNVSLFGLVKANQTTSSCKTTNMAL